LKEEVEQLKKDKDQLLIDNNSLKANIHDRAKNQDEVSPTLREGIDLSEIHI